jgi:hypothetical protein
VLTLDHFAHPVLVLFDAREVGTAAQHQQLRQNRLGAPMRLLDHSVLVRSAR